MEINKPQKHIHKYQMIEIGGEKIERFKDPITGRMRKRLVKTGGRMVFKCILPGCTTFKERHLTLGEQVICWECSESMIMDEWSIKKPKPIHFTCRKQRVAI